MRTPQVSAPWSKHGAAELITRLHHDGWYVSDQAGREVSGPFASEDDAEQDIRRELHRREMVTLGDPNASPLSEG